jgi:DNA-binding MarR family transcriptional regulator
MSREESLWKILELVRQNQLLTDQLDQGAVEYLGVNRTDGNAIDVIQRRARVTAGELAQELRLSTGAVTAVVDRLERAGYARRVPDPDDRRRVLIEVMPVVDELSRRVYGTPEENVPMFDDYSDEDLAAIVRFQELTRTWLEGRLANLAQLPPKD